MKTFLSILLVALSLLIACDNPSDPNIFRYDREQSFNLYQEYQSIDGAVKLTIDSLSDSRCPQGVECIWEGEVTVNMSVNIDQGYQLELHSVLHPKDTIQNYEFELTGADPYPVYQEEIRNEDYRVRLKVSPL